MRTQSARDAHRTHRFLGLFLWLLACAGLGSFALAAEAPANEAVAKPDDGMRPVVVDFASAKPFAFLGWEKKTEAVAGGLRVKAPDARGGLTCPLTTNLTAYAEWTPRLSLTINPGNQLSLLVVTLSDADGTKNSYQFPLDKLTSGSTTILLANDGASLREPGAVGEPGTVPGLDLANLKEVALLGTWMSQVTDVKFDRLDLVPPDAAILKAREALRMRLAKEADDKRKAEEAAAKHKAEFLAGAPHPKNGAKVLNIGAVAPDILGVEIQSGEYVPGAMVPYAAQPDDKLSGGKKEWVVRDGKMLEEIVGPAVQRKNAKGQDENLGVRSFDGKWLLQANNTTGTLLDTLTIEELAAYEVSSTDDSAYAQPTAPTAVYRKSKPDAPQAGGGMAIRHRLYLKLPAPLKDGASYTVRFKGVNTRQESVVYKHDTRTARSEAVHITQIGYRPDDPFKRGYLSVWLGTGGAYQPKNVEAFEIIDAKTGAPVFSGKPELAKTTNAAVPADKEYTQTTVYGLDFSAFRTPGTYRVHVPGIGSSYPFTIADNVWEEAFKTGMRGVLSQRTGIALGPPFLDFKRPRSGHPDDGVKFYQTDINISKGQEGPRGDALVRLWKANGKLEEVKGLWGGYQDAGDWDTYTTTLATADELTEAFEISPEFAKRLKLSLPPAEAENKIPDLLDEALWGLAAYKRLQLPNGAVRDGYGDGWGVRGGDVSWIDSNPVAVYAPSTETSWLYASIAARMAVLLAPYDKAQATEYGDSAVKAWKWAEAQPAAAETTGTQAADAKERAKLHNHGGEAAAAVALYALTKDKAYHERFKQICEILAPKDTNYKGGWIEPLQQAEATFLYARLSDDLADPVLKENAKKLYILAGNVAVEYMQGNPFNLATVNSGFPQFEFCAYFTSPGMGIQIVRAHALTGDPRYLAAIVASTGFGLGANPENVVFTTGLGADPIRFPLKIDNLVTGQPAPVGITVYGPSDQHKASDMSGWVYQWILTPARMVPDPHTWPSAESYPDIFTWPGANEYCVNSPLTEAACTWCYLAARAPVAAK
jgi:endoglucanase